ncbi:hypothetical protein ACS0TY_007690 [Phlomoides rotata]
MIKTMAMQSETVIEIYRKDLEEFGTGLRKETELLRETASRAVKELPASLEAAHGVLKSTVNIISKESLGFSPDGESGTPGTNRSSGRYSRFEAQVSAIQNDLNTFCVEPEDGEDYSKWKLGFELENYIDVIESLIGGNGIMEGVYKRVVPSSVAGETFWCRYLYRVEKLKQQESLRANLVRRAISVDDDELSSWDFDDEEEEDDGNGENVASGGISKPTRDDGNKGDASDGEASNVVELSNKSTVDVSKEENPQTVGEVKRDEKVKSEDSNDGKVMVEETGESGEKSDAKIVSSHQSKVVEEEEEEDLGWDEIESDTGSGGGKRISADDHGGSPKKDDLRKRLTGGGGDDDDDLNWDIEDDDESVKA